MKSIYYLLVCMALFCVTAPDAPEKPKGTNGPKESPSRKI